MNKNKLIQFAKLSPKAELHLHIEGTLEAEMLFKLALKNKTDIPFKSVEEVKEAYNFNNLSEFLDIYYQGANVLLTEDDFFELTYAYLKKAHENNVVHSEFFFDPQTHTERGVAFESVFNGIYKATQKAKSDFGISSFIIMSFLRNLSEESAFQTLESALPFKEHILGIGLDSNELGNPPEKFERVYKKAREYGFKLMAHAGEEGPAEYVWNSVTKLNIDRIDHGNNSLNDDNLIKHISDRKLGLTVCPLSNLSLKVVDDLKNHPIKKMLQNSLMACINSDDPAYFGGYINDNFRAIIDNIDFEAEEIKQLIINSFKVSFLLKEEINSYISDVEKIYEKIFNEG